MSARSFGDIASSMLGRVDPDRPREQIWRDSHDVDHWKAKPFQWILDRTRASKNAFGSAMLLTLQDDIVQQALEAEKARERGEKRDPLRLLDVDVRVLRYMIDSFNHGTGMLYPAQATIAEKVGLSSPSVANDSLQRLDHWGYLSSVRRTVTVETEGRPGPQRKQTTNAYFFDCKAKMRPRTWAHFWKLLKDALKKIGKAGLTAAVALFTRVVLPPSRCQEAPVPSRRPGKRGFKWIERDSRCRIYPGKET